MGPYWVQMICLPLSVRVIPWVWELYDYPSASEVILQSVCKIKQHQTTNKTYLIEISLAQRTLFSVFVITAPNVRLVRGIHGGAVMTTRFNY